MYNLSKVSVVIPNYNYAEFVGAAIESALALDWPDVEVIVVDDGSTDHSKDVIGRYENRITAIYRENGGQVAATNDGYAVSSGGLVVFLDSDDLVAPDLIKEVFPLVTEKVSKVQVQMESIDFHGRPLSNVFPKYGASLDPAKIRRWAGFAGSYPTPPGSGNVYTRQFLDKLFPLDAAMDFAPDSHTLSTAPFLGDVVTLAKPLVSYRVHGRNMGAMAELHEARFSKEVGRSITRSRFSASLARQNGVAVRPDAFRRSLNVCSLRASSLVLTPSRHPLEGDNRLVVLRDLMRSVVTPQGNSAKAQLALFLWVLAIAAAPRRMSRMLILWRYVPVSRPRLMRRVISRI